MKFLVPIPVAAVPLVVFPSTITSAITTLADAVFTLSHSGGDHRGGSASADDNISTSVHSALPALRPPLVSSDPVVVVVLCVFAWTCTCACMLNVSRSTTVLPPDLVVAHFITIPVI